MIAKDKIIFTTACVFPNDSYIHFLRDSAKRFEVPLRPYGLGESYVDWCQIKITLFCQAAQAWLAEGLTHVFYTDGRDSFMLAGVDEILSKYERLGEPPYLISAEDQPYPFRHLGPKFPDPGHPWRYLGAGQFMGEIKYMVDMWTELRGLYGNIPDENHDQGWLQLAWAEGVLNLSEFIIDTGCRIFQCASVDRRGGEVENYVQKDKLLIHDGRVVNVLTGSKPCAIHFPGGYSDPKTGKDSTLGEVWSRLGWA